jgi:hypothetical protein
MHLADKCYRKIKFPTPNVVLPRALKILQNVFFGVILIFKYYFKCSSNAILELIFQSFKKVDIAQIEAVESCSSFLSAKCDRFLTQRKSKYHYHKRGRERESEKGREKERERER